MVIALIGLGIGFMLYRWIYAPNVVSEKADTYFYVYSSDDYLNVVERLNKSGLVTNIRSFKWVAERKNYPNTVKPGRYFIQPNMSNNQLVNLLRSGAQVPVNVMFNNIRFLPELAGELAQQLEPDSAHFMAAFTNDSLLRYYGFTPNTVLALFIPNTYELYWNTSPEDFMERMAKEFRNFWTEERKQKALALNLSQSEVATLASIVQQETARNDEKPKIAGVYLNRLRIGMPLQADPTLLFALQDFSIRRVLNVHKKIDSPYNTYKYKGLPPGPISLPEISSLTAVLNPADHNFYYFCAKEDFSGYHNFASTYAEHLRNARRYQSALNQRRIYN